MTKSFVVVFRVVVVCSAFAVLGHAGTCEFPSGQVPPGMLADEVCVVGLPSGATFPPSQFGVTQFNPQLGQLQDVRIDFQFENVQGTMSYIYYGDPTCPPIPACYDFSPAVGYSVGVSSNSIPGFQLGYTDTDGILVGRFDGPVGPGSAGWSDPRSRDIQTFTDAAQALAFIGTEDLQFTLDGNAFSCCGTAGPGEVTGVTLDSFDYQAVVTYDYIVAQPAPEPSLFVVTGALFGLVVITRVRRRLA